MSSFERLLGTVLRLYQDVHDQAKTDQILGTTTTLLTHLSNPLNLSLLTSHFLTAPAIWNRPDPGLRTCLRLISIFNTAAIHVRRNELDAANQPRTTASAAPVGGNVSGSGLSSEAWARAVVKGADDRSARWQHLLILTGMLMGLEGEERRSLSQGMRHTLEEAVVTAANLALKSQGRDGPQASGAVVLALNYAFPLLSEHSQSLINCDLLLPVAVASMIGPDGFHNGIFLGHINTDIRHASQQIHWHSSSPSFQALKQLSSNPLVAGAGPLSRLVAFAIERAHDPKIVLAAQEALLTFARTLEHQWNVSGNLATLEISLQSTALGPETAASTWPVLWQLLKKILYSTVMVLQAVVTRSLLDPRLRSAVTETSLATKSLHIFRHLYFISSNHGANAFQVYTFTYLASIDTLVRYPEASAAFLREIMPQITGPGTGNSVRLTSELFYLNLAEHFSLVLSPEVCDALIVQPAMFYLSPSETTHPSIAMSPRMIDLFEAAHSAVLSVMSCPQNAAITTRLAPFYAEALFSSFPSHISPRQFRVAFKTMMQILSPPFPISATDPELAETLLEMVRIKAMAAATAPLPPTADEEAQQALGHVPAPTSEQSALVLTMIDALPFLALDIVEEWMTVTAETVWQIADPAMREAAKKRFWDILVSGEMDVERAAIGVAWWGTKGGGALVLHGPASGAAHARDRFLMSGALPAQRDTTTGSRL